MRSCWPSRYGVSTVSSRLTNLKAAKTLGLTLPPALLAAADDVIE